MKGSELNVDWLVNDPTAMTEPVIVEEKTGLGMKLPDPSITVKDVAEAVGADMPVEVIDVASQSDLANWTLDAWARYYTDKDRSKVRNVISLEVSATPLGAQLDPPAVVAELDWVEKFWPAAQRGPFEYPKVQKYCLMSVAKCWTDWHVDFAASSVWYHILRGAKTFYFIRPTPENLAAYERWSGSSDRQENTWLGDEVDAVYEVNLTQGNTMIIPTGWIHAVYTPADSLVFGGNFLHSLNIATQLELHRIEIATKVPKKFRFPMFITLLWHVTRYYHEELSKLNLPDTPNAATKLDLPPHLSRRVLQGLKALSVKMIDQAGRATHTWRDKEGITPEQRKTARNNIPWDQISDPDGLATSFRKVVLAALGETEEDQRTSAVSAVVPKKRKAVEEHTARIKKLNSPSVAAPKNKTVVAPAIVTETESEERTAGLLPRPVEDGMEPGKPEPCQVVTKTKTTRSVQVVEAKKVIQVTRVVVSTEEKVIWDEALPEPYIDLDTTSQIFSSQNGPPTSSQLSELSDAILEPPSSQLSDLTDSTQNTLMMNEWSEPGSLEAALMKAINMPTGFANGTA